MGPARLDKDLFPTVGRAVKEAAEKNPRTDGTVSTRSWQPSTTWQTIRTHTTHPPTHPNTMTTKETDHTLAPRSCSGGRPHDSIATSTSSFHRDAGNGCSVPT